MRRGLFKKVFGDRNPFKQVIVVRGDLKLSPGKLAAQVAHAAVSAAQKSPHKKAWMHQGQKKVVVGCDNLKDLKDIYAVARKAGHATALIEDAGRTEIAPGTVTCLGIGPGLETELDEITGKLKLL